MKTIVTHLSPDIDAQTAVWLVKRFLPGWTDAQIKYVPAGTTLGNAVPDTDADIIHVDTGFGKFDHHQTNAFTCAAKLVYQHLIDNNFLNNRIAEPMRRMVEQVNQFDHFQEVYYPHSDADYFDFSLHQAERTLRLVVADSEKLTETVFNFLDAVLLLFRNKIQAEEEISSGFAFKTRFGKSLAVESKSTETMRLAQKRGFRLVITKNPKDGGVNIKTIPDKKLDLTPVYEKVKKEDPKALWFLHISKNMLLNASITKPDYVPSSLPLKRLIEIVKSV